MEGILDVEVATCATAFTCPETGHNWILIVNEGLYFGASLDHSLINPNQIRIFGIPVWDNLFDPDKEMGIKTEEIFIPFQTNGATIFFESHVPTDQELKECPH